MFKMSFAIYRRPDLSPEQFCDHWLNVHAPLLKKYAKALRIRRYIQLHGGDYEATRGMTEARNCRPPHDGVVEIWWDSEEDRLAAAETSAGKEASLLLREDELRFCDMSRSSVLFGREHVIVSDGPVPSDD